MTIKKSKIYTKQGDGGFTSLVGGQRIHKSEETIDKYGEIDELNSYIGLLISHTVINPKFKSVVSYLKVIQNKLFDLGSNMACLPEDRLKFKLVQINDKIISDLELEIDTLDRELVPLKNFILPGGTQASSIAQITRAVCRRVERSMLRGDIDNLPILSLQFVNRLSDYFFILARYLNHVESVPEEIWNS